MAEKLEQTCENCEYENEDMEGAHCRHCIHNAEEHFEPKINHEKEIRNKAIDEFAEKFIFKAVCEGCSGCCGCYEEGRQPECEDWKAYMEIAEQMKAGDENG